MIKDIKYGGYSVTPSDYECQDGDLAVSVNVVNEDGALHPVKRPKIAFSYDGRIRFIHKTNKFTHYIGERVVIQRPSGAQYLDWIGEDDKDKVNTFYENRDPLNILDIIQVVAVGNTLVFLTKTGMHYFLWNADENTYSYLGDSMPETVISFGLQGELIDDDDYSTGSIKLNKKQQSVEEFDDENVGRVTEYVLAQVNKFIANEATNSGKFVMPFLVRYAYRLYDGTITRHSAPVLMVAANDTNPIAVRYRSTLNDGYEELGYRAIGVVHQLDYAVGSKSQIDALKNWKDIIRSVDIFISAPLYKYDQSGNVSGDVHLDMTDLYSICKDIGQDSGIDKSRYPLRYQKNTWYRLAKNKIIPPYERRANLPHFSDEEYNAKVRECSTFYFLKSIDIDDLSAERTIIEVPDDYLPSLVTREVMTDDYDSHDKLIPEYAFNYNSRLNITNIQKEIFSGFDLLCQFNFTDGYIPYINQSLSDTFENDTPLPLRCFVFIKQDGQSIVVEPTAGQIAVYAWMLYFYYPNTNAYKAVFVRGDRKYEVKLTSHPFLNGSVFFEGFNSMDPYEAPDAEMPIPSESRGIEIRNKIYTSEINNPFLFPLLGINTVGTGRIIGISTAAKALSQGQFGQFPLYAFTSEDGVWALEVSSTGSYSAKQPITREICVNPDSITQIDSSVLFATDRGIMMISGSNVQCISDSLLADDAFSLSDLSRSDKILGILNSKSDEPVDMDEISQLPFRRFLVGCRMIYDYKNQRIIVYNNSVRYAYVYSLKSHSWGMMRSEISDGLNSYPDALAMTDDGNVLDFSNPEDASQRALVVTRPFTFGMPNEFKTVDTVIQRGMIRRDHVSQVLFGSNDLFNWHVVWSSADKYMRGFRGTPYKAFRLALVCDLDPGESLYGFTVQFAQRLANRPR